MLGVEKYVNYLSSVCKSANYSTNLLVRGACLADVMSVAYDLDDLSYLDKLCSLSEDKSEFFHTRDFLTNNIYASALVKIKKSGLSEDIKAKIILNCGDLLKDGYEILVPSSAISNYGIISLDEVESEVEESLQGVELDDSGSTDYFEGLDDDEEEEKPKIVLVVDSDIDDEEEEEYVSVDDSGETVVDSDIDEEEEEEYVSVDVSGGVEIADEEEEKYVSADSAAEVELDDEDEEEEYVSVDSGKEGVEDVKYVSKKSVGNTNYTLDEDYAVEEEEEYVSVDEDEEEEKYVSVDEDETFDKEEDCEEEDIEYVPKDDYREVGRPAGDVLRGREDRFRGNKPDSFGAGGKHNWGVKGVSKKTADDELADAIVGVSNLIFKSTSIVKGSIFGKRNKK